MNRAIRLRPAVAAALLLAPTAFGQPGAEAPPAVPKALEPPAGHVLVLSLRAEGFQVYECRPKKGDAAAFEWALVAPDAILYDDRGEKAGTHGAGPGWQANDGSKVVAAKKTSAPAPGGRAVDWLLLQATANEGAGAFAKVTYIQRVDTWAGLPPAAGATKENAGRQVRVRYEATYRFFGPKP
jgi:hypothetical protein